MIPIVIVPLYLLLFLRWAVTEDQIEKLKLKLSFHRSFVLSSFTGANIEEVSLGPTRADSVVRSYLCLFAQSCTRGTKEDHHKKKTKAILTRKRRAFCNKDI